MDDDVMVLRASSSRLLVNVNPELAAQYSAANERDVNTVTVGTSEKFGWLCSTCSFAWSSRINHILSGIGCPSCNKKILLTSNPELAAEWSTKNSNSPSEIKPGSRERVWWVCPIGHDDYLAAVANRRLLGTRCPICKVPKDGRSLLDVAPELADEWSEKNKSPAHLVFAKSADTGLWSCRKCNYEWQTRISYRVKREQPCPRCSGMSIFDKSIGVVRPDLLAEWSASNNKSPYEVAIGAHNLYLWECSSGHTYQMRPFERRDGYGCRECRLEQNSLLAKHPELSKEFDATKNNGKTAADYFSNSSYEVWWRCLKIHHSWRVSVSSRTSKKGYTGCPQCGTSGTSKIEEVIRIALLSGKVISDIRDSHNNLVDVPWRKRKTQRVDVLGTYKGVPFVCEFDGWYWHSGTRNNDSVASLERDTAKTIALLDASYIVVRIREISGKNNLALLDIEHPRLFQVGWQRPKDGDISEIRKIIHDWLTTLDPID